MSSIQPFTYLMFVFNEEARIADILHHAVQWADEVLILDKQSTDRTSAICAEHGPKVRVVEIPFTPQGHDDVVSACRLTAHDWLWVGTASEIPTRKVVDQAKRIVAEKPDLDLVYVPRKIYSFGCDTPDSPWGIRHYPFLINRRRTVITNTIHNNFHPQDKASIEKISFAEDCCVHHYTHTTARSYLAAMTQYFEAESQRPDQAELIKEALDNLDSQRHLRSLEGRDAFGLECAWRLYWLGTALFAWDKLRAADAPQKYQAARADILERDWPTATVPTIGTTPSIPMPLPLTAPSINVLSRTDGPANLNPTGEDQLLVALRGRPICQLVKTVYQIGAHRFQEKKLLFEIFPHLERVILFEPLPHLFASLREQERGDARITVLPYAISERNGEVAFHVASNDGASSSILPFGEHQQLFPHVRTTGQITVQTRTLTTAMAAHQLSPPDFLFLDVQGAEFQILATLSDNLLHRLRMIYTEASTAEVYAGSKPLKELERILAADFSFVGYSPLKEQIPSHGNALFVNRSLAWLLLPPEPPVATESIRETIIRQSLWARVLCRVLPWKLRRSLRKRLTAVRQALTD